MLLRIIWSTSSWRVHNFQWLRCWWTRCFPINAIIFIWVLLRWYCWPMIFMSRGIQCVLSHVQGFGCVCPFGRRWCIRIFSIWDSSIRSLCCGFSIKEECGSGLAFIVSVEGLEELLIEKLKRFVCDCFRCSRCLGYMRIYSAQSLICFQPNVSYTRLRGQVWSDCDDYRSKHHKNSWAHPYNRQLQCSFRKYYRWLPLFCSNARLQSQRKSRIWPHTANAGWVKSWSDTALLNVPKEWTRNRLRCPLHWTSRSSRGLLCTSKSWRSC